MTLEPEYGIIKYMPRCIFCDISNDAPSLSTTRDAIPPIRWNEYQGGFICDGCWDEAEHDAEWDDPWGIDEAWEGEDYTLDKEY